MVKSQKLTFVYGCYRQGAQRHHDTGWWYTLAKYKWRKRDYIAAGAGMRDSEGICGGLGSAISVYSTGH
jgi:hypothetical protein